MSPIYTNQSGSCLLSRAPHAEASLAEDRTVAARRAGNPLTFKSHRETSEPALLKIQIGLCLHAFPCNYFGEGFMGSAGLQGVLLPASCCAVPLAAPGLCRAPSEVTSLLRRLGRPAQPGDGRPGSRGSPCPLRPFSGCTAVPQRSCPPSY